MSDEWFFVLKTFAESPGCRIPCSQYTALFDEPHVVLSLLSAGYLERRKENPNYIYLLPEDQRDAEFFFLTAAGKEAYLIEQQLRAKEIKANKQAERSLKVSVITLVVSVLTLIITVIAFVKSCMP